MALVVQWHAPDPATLGIAIAEALRLPRPDPGADRLAFLLDGGTLVVQRAVPGGAERLVVAGPADGRVRGSARGVGLLGLAWATVELDRGCAEAGRQVGLPVQAFVDAPDDRWLGARARVAAAGGTTVVVLEPATEGRLAAALARLGEGPVALYARVPGPSMDATRPGPLGPAAMALARRPWGPFLLAVPRVASIRATRGTIQR